MFITAEEIKSLSTFEEVAALEVPEIDRYIGRADRWIHRATGRRFDEGDDEFTQEDVRVATILLVEYLWFWDNPDIRETMMGPFENEDIGSFGVKYKSIKTWREAVPGEETGIKELDNILKSLRYKVAIGSFFRVSGPSRNDV
jgi:hypothetical protein